MKRGGAQQSPLQLHRLTSDDEVAKAVPVSDWGSIFDKEEAKALGYEGYLSKKAQKMGLPGSPARGLPSRWIRRYYLFDEEKSMLMYWGNKGEKDKIKPRGSYLATDFLTVTVPDPTRPSRFDVKLKDKYGDRLLCLRADKDYEARQWVESIRKYVAMEVAKAQNAEEKEFVGEWTAGKTIEMMNKGQKMVAYFANGDRRAVKLFCRSLCLYVCHINGTPNQPILQIPLRSVTDIYVGKQTPGFSTAIATDIPPDKCFSVKSKQYTVDVEAATPHQTLGWLKGLQYLLTNSGKSVLYDEEVAEGQGQPGGGGASGGGAREGEVVEEGVGPDLIQTPLKKKNSTTKKEKGEDDQAPSQIPPLSPASSVGDEKSGNSKKRKNPKSPTTPMSLASPGPVAIDRSPLTSPLGAFDSDEDERKRLLDRLHTLEQERDSLKAKIENGGGSNLPSAELPSIIVLPSLASLLERYRVLTTEELPLTLNSYANVLATQKSKKITKRYYRRSGIALTKAMEDCWKHTSSYLTGLIQKSVSTMAKTDFSEGKNILSNESKEKHIMHIFMQFIGYLNPELHPFPAQQIGSEILQSMGKLTGFPEAEKLLKEFITHTLQLWWALILVPNTDVKPVWKEDYTEEHYKLISDLNVKDGSIRFPPLITGDGRVIYKGEARPVRKDKVVKKK